MTSNTTQGDSNLPPEEVELDKLLYRYSVQRDMYYSDLKDGVITEDEWAAIRDKIQVDTKEALMSWREAYADKARIDELERLYLVYGSKEKPASLDNLFSLGKKGEVCATPIKDRLSALRKQQGDT